MIIKNPVTDTITISEFSLNVHLESTKRKKTISLQVKDNKLTIKAPKAMSKKKLDELIQKKIWIRQRAIISFEEQGIKNRDFIEN